MVVQYLFKGSLSVMMSMMEYLITVTHFPLLNVKIPATSSRFFAYLFEAAKFDPMTQTDAIYTWMFGYVESPPININFESLGYETTLVQNNLGSLFLILIYKYFVLIVMILTYKSEKCQKFLHKHGYN